jgi:hypothetical protein
MLANPQGPDGSLLEDRRSLCWPHTEALQMTIDERLERLTERHEALAQTVELMGHEMREMFAATTLERP